MRALYLVPFSCAQEIDPSSLTGSVFKKSEYTHTTIRRVTVPRCQILSLLFAGIGDCWCKLVNSVHTRSSQEYLDQTSMFDQTYPQISDCLLPMKTSGFSTKVGVL